MPATFGDVLAAWGGHRWNGARPVVSDKLMPSRASVKPGSLDADFDQLGVLGPADDATLIGGSDAGVYVLLFGAGDTTLVLTRHVRERGDMTLERASPQAHWACPASMMDSATGYLRRSGTATLAFVISSTTSGQPWRPMPRRPALHPAGGGYRATVVGGRITQADGTPTGATPGRMLHSGVIGVVTHDAEIEILATGLQFPQGPVALADGSILVVEIASGALTRVLIDGSTTTIAECGGGPNGAAVGPDGALYVCNNGG